jgi:hypothetical protein
LFWWQLEPINVFNPVSCPCIDDVSITAQYFIPDSTVVGTPRLGLAIRVSDDSTCDSATCYGLIADYTDSTIKVVVWNSQSLSDYGTIIQSIAMSNARTVFNGVSGVMLNAFGINSDANTNCTVGNIQYTIGGGFSDLLTPHNEVPCSATNRSVGFIAVGVNNANTVNVATLQSISTVDTPNLLSVTSNVA